MLLGLVFAAFVASVVSKDAAVCQWNSGISGAHYDLQPLTIPSSSKDQCPKIKDGDIPCTPEIEQSYGYVWNFCSNVNAASMPAVCSEQGKTGVVLQYSPDATKGSECFIAAHFDPAVHNLEYGLLNPEDPSKGVTIKYPAGEPCHTGKTSRSSTVEVMCANTRMQVVSAEEPSHCEYHLVMKSYHGCPTDCPVTEAGLCNSHGHCAMDSKADKAYCFCNQGFYGSSCSSTVDPYATKSYDGYSVQIGFLVVLLVTVIVLTGGLAYMGYRVMDFRKQSLGGSASYGLLGGENEMVPSIDFRS